ncbi:FtsB family cell division protein [Thermocrinis sp.]
MRQGLKAKKNFGDIGPDSLPFIFFIAVLFFTLYNLFFGRYNIFEIIKMKKNITEINAQIQNIKKENELIEEELRLLKEDKDFYLEKLAREKMQLQRPGEKIILFKE